MAILANRVAVATATTGTGTVTLGSALSNAFCTFAEAGVANASVVTYLITEGNDFEIGRGTYTTSGTTLSRTTVLLSKISGTSGTTKMNLAGAAEVRIMAAAQDMQSDVAITGGTIAGITDLAVADGGTGASTTINARTNLGLGTSSTVQFGTLGVGVVAASAILHVAGPADSTGGIRVRSTSNNTDRLNMYGAGTASIALQCVEAGQMTFLNSAASSGLRMNSDASVEFPSTGTTASAANAFLDSGASNKILRSTSSLVYKRDVEPIEPARVTAALDVQGIWYRSLASADNPEWSWYGFAAEDVAAIDPRLVHWGYGPEDYEVIEVEHVNDVERIDEIEHKLPDGTEVVERVPRIERVMVIDRETRLKADAQLKPDGVMYERFVVIHQEVLREHQVVIRQHQEVIRQHQEVIRQQQEAIAALESRVEALEAAR